MEIVSICIMPTVEMIEGNLYPVCFGINHNIFTLNPDTEIIGFIVLSLIQIIPFSHLALFFTCKNFGIYCKFMIRLG